MDMELIPDMVDMSDIPVDAAAEVALDIAMSMVDDDMCDMSMLASGLLFNRGKSGCATRTFRWTGRFGRGQSNGSRIIVYRWCSNGTTSSVDLQLRGYAQLSRDDGRSIRYA